MISRKKKTLARGSRLGAEDTVPQRGFELQKRLGAEDSNLHIQIQSLLSYH